MHSILDIVGVVWIVLIWLLYFVVALIPCFFGNYKEGDPRAERKPKIAGYGFCICLIMMGATMVVRMIVLGFVYRQTEQFTIETITTRVVESQELNPVAEGIYLFRDEDDAVHFLTEDGKKKSAPTYGLNYDTDKNFIETYETLEVAYFSKDVDRKYPFIALNSRLYYSIHLSSIDQIQDVNMTWD
ncbi:hypothetical protein IKW73_00170 [Candidatus Saccharibacteria bacterium]|nr:hypothetical protein [Candidatus Saccharibacteria bacterium]